MITQGKWEICKQGGANIGITSKNMFIATASTINCGLIAAEANAEFICKAVNCHADLLEALKGLVEFWGAEDYGEEQQGLMSIAKQSIAKAEQ